jgi:alkyldihydroxyacetonephosphate synthase
MNTKVYENNINELVIEEMRKILPQDAVSTKIVDRLAVCHGAFNVEYKWIQAGKYPYIPDLVVWPETTEQVSEILKIANKNKTVVIPYGGGSGSVMGSVFFNGGICLDTKKLTKFILNEKGMSVTVGAGWNIGQLEDELNRFGYTMGHFPQSMNSATIAGSVATSAIGTFSTKYGKFDDILIALEVVLPTGEVLYTKDSPKASTGINLNYLFLGSEGSYGICTEVTAKIWLKPEARKFSVYTFKTTHDGFEAVRKIVSLGQATLAVVRLYDEYESVFTIDTYKFEKGYALLYLGFEGRKDQVDLEMNISDEICRAEGGLYKGDQAAKQWEKDRLDTSYGLGTTHLPNGAAESLEVSASWDKLEDVWLAMRNAIAPYAQIIHVHFSHMYHTGGNLYCIIHTIRGKNSEDAEKNFLKCVKKALDACVKAGGSISHHHGVGTLKSKWMSDEHNNGFEVMKKIKRAIDPNNIMNPPVLGLGGEANVG